MSVLNRNEFFYTALRIAVAQDKNPDWIFKTNLLHIDNIATSIKTDNIIRPNINLDSVYNYLNEIKPYHVRYDNYAIQYTKNDEVAEVQIEDERNLEILLGYQNVSEYPTTYGYDNLQYDFEYPGLNTNGNDYKTYNPEYGVDDWEANANQYYQTAGWYAFKNNKSGRFNPKIFDGRDSCNHGTLNEDPLGASYDYQPTYNEFKKVLQAYNSQNDTELSIEDLIANYYRDRYYFENSANFLYILNQNQSFEWVKQKLYNNYKGLIVKGGAVKETVNGYETTEYDNELYDYITYENRYYVSDEDVSDKFMELESKYNIDRVVPTSTTKFYTPEVPFATKKFNVYLNEVSRLDNFFLIGECYLDGNWLNNFQSPYAYANVKRAFYPLKKKWEISVDINIDKFEPVIINDTERYNKKLITILGSSYYKYSLPQVYIIGSTIYFDVSSNGRYYDIRLSKDGIQTNTKYTITIGFTGSKYYLKVNDEIVEYSTRKTLYSEPTAVLRVGNSTYQQDLINYVPFHYIGGIFEYHEDYPYYDEDRSLIYVPTISVVYPISKTLLDKGTLSDVSELPDTAKNGEYYTIGSNKYVYYEGSWYPYDMNQYIQQLGLYDIFGSQNIITYYTLYETLNNQKQSVMLNTTTSSSEIPVPSTFTNGLLVSKQGKLYLEDKVQYLGKYDHLPSDLPMDTYPAYLFNIRDDGFYFRASANDSWLLQEQFCIVATVKRANATGRIMIDYLPTFRDSESIRYLYQNATIDMRSLKITVNGKEYIFDGEKYRFLHLNTDYTIKLDDNRKEYIELLDENKDVRTLEPDSVLRIDCIDYDYLYDVMYVNRADSENDFSRYKTFLGSFASVEDMFRHRGSIKIKNHDYFYNTTTNSEWVLELNGTNLNITQDFNTYDLEITLTEENYKQEIFEVLEFTFSWIDTGFPYGTIKEQDLMALKGTRLLRPNNTAKGSEEIRTRSQDGVIIDIYENVSYLDMDNIQLSPHVYSETLDKGTNKELYIEPSSNDGVLQFINGLYKKPSLRWKSRTGLNPLPNTPLNVITDVNSAVNRFIEIEKDTIDIVYSKMLYAQTETTFSVKLETYESNNDIVITVDGIKLDKSEYTYSISDKQLNVKLNDGIIKEGKKYCYGIYVVNPNTVSFVYSEEIDKLPYEITFPTQYLNYSVLNNILLFDKDGKKVLPPFMKWYYLEETTSSLQLPINDTEGVRPEQIQVFVGVGHNLAKMLRVQSTQYTIEDNTINFVRPISSDLTVAIIIPTSMSYNISLSFNNGAKLVDYDLNYIVDYFENFIVDYGTDDGEADGTATIFSSSDLNVKTLVYIGNAAKFNFRQDVYEITKNNEYVINSDKFDRKSISVWKNGVLLDTYQYEVVGNTITVKSEYNSDEDIIQIWYKVNPSKVASIHDKIIISDTNTIYNLKNLPDIRTYLVYPFAYSDVKMYVSNANYLTQPNIDPVDVTKSTAGRIQIGNEILEFWGVDYNDTIPGTTQKCHSLSGFVRGILGGTSHDIEKPYPVNTPIQDIGVRYESTISHKKNVKSRIEYQTVTENWIDAPKEWAERPVWNERRESEKYKLDSLKLVKNEKTGRWYSYTSFPLLVGDVSDFSEDERTGKGERYLKNISLLPWYNIPGIAEKDSDIKVWKTEQIKVLEDYIAGDDYLDISNDRNIDKPSDYMYKSKLGNFTYDYNSIVTYEHMFYRSSFVSDNINIELYNGVDSKVYTNIGISGTLENAARIINNTVDKDILVCKAVYSELEEQSYMQFTLKNGYSMRIVENDDANSFFIQELFGGIQKSTKGNVLTAEIDITNGAGIAIIGADEERKEVFFKEPTGGLTSIELFANEANSYFNKTKLWFSVKQNPYIENIYQLNIVNYSRKDAYIEDMSSLTDNLGILGIKSRIIGCPVINEDNENGEVIIENNNVGRIKFEGESYEFKSFLQNEEVTRLIGINIDYDIPKDTLLMGSKLIKQELDEDYYIRFNAVYFYERLPQGTLIRIQNKDIIISSDNMISHSHEES